MAFAGPKNRVGPKGDKGDKGDRGLRGPEGEMGPIGPRGPKGDKGVKGDQGLPGINGLNGINQTVITHFKKKGKIICMYQEIQIPAGQEATILEYTVENLHSLDLLHVLVSGDNIGRFVVEKDSNGDIEILAKERTNFTKFNAQIPFNRYQLKSGDILRIKGENVRGDSADFNASLLGDLYVDRP